MLHCGAISGWKDGWMGLDGSRDEVRYGAPDSAHKKVNTCLLNCCGEMIRSNRLLNYCCGSVITIKMAMIMESLLYPIDCYVWPAHSKTI